MMARHPLDARPESFPKRRLAARNQLSYCREPLAGYVAIIGSAKDFLHFLDKWVIVIAKL